MPTSAADTHRPLALQSLARYPAGRHWANPQCQAWWVALPGLVGGRQWYDAFGQYPWTFSYSTYTASGANQRPMGYWSPIWENGSYQYNGADAMAARPGALNGTFFGPLQWNYGNGGTIQQAYGSSNLNLNTACPTGGTIAVWHRPTLAYNAESGNDIWLYQGPAGGAATYFGIYLYSNAIYITYYNGTFYQAGQALTSAVWSTSSWTHWVFTWQAGGKSNIYVNGQLWLAGSTNLPSTINNLSTTYLLTLGALPNTSYSRFLTSCFDDLNLWNYPMSAAQAEQVYAQSSAGWPGRLESRPFLYARSPLPPPSFSPGPYITPFVYDLRQILE